MIKYFIAIKLKTIRNDKWAKAKTSIFSKKIIMKKPSAKKLSIGTNELACVIFLEIQMERQ